MAYRDLSEGSCVHCGKKLAVGTGYINTWTPPQYRDWMDPPRVIIERTCQACKDAGEHGSVNLLIQRKGTK